MKTLNERVHLVTGASRGIGRAIARRLWEEGARVEAVARSREPLAELAAECPGVGFHVCDVTRESEVNATVKGVLEKHGRLDALINNAGVGRFGAIEETSYEDLLRVFEVNVGGAFLFTRAVLPAMRSRGDGDIINIASVVGSKGYPRQVAYGASKHALLGLTKSLAVELQPDGVRVRSICPGGVDTDLIAEARPDLDRSTLMRPADIAEIVVFLLAASPTAVVDNINVRRPGSSPWF